MSGEFKTSVLFGPAELPDEEINNAMKIIDFKMRKATRAYRFKLRRSEATRPNPRKLSTDVLVMRA